MNEQELKELKNKVKAAVYLFLANDQKLLELDAHEQAISHRIAVYLEPLFKGLNVDCEYNKHLEASKKLELRNLRPDDHRGCACKACNKIVENQMPDREETLFRPDILVHSRGIDGKNIIAIEVKKENECFFDQAKLIALTNKDGEYKYDLGMFIYFPEGVPRCKCFQGGIEVNCE